MPTPGVPADDGQIGLPVPRSPPAPRRRGGIRPTVLLAALGTATSLTAALHPPLCRRTLRATSDQVS